MTLDERLVRMNKARRLSVRVPALEWEVYVSTEQGTALLDRRTPVRVTGKVTAETTTRTTFNGNGRVKVHSAYTIPSPEIEVFQASSSPQR